MGRDCGGNGKGLCAAFARGTAGVRDFCAGLWAGGRGGLSGAALRVAAGAQRAPDLLALGTARLFGELFGGAGGFAGAAGGVFRARGVCGDFGGQSLRVGERDRGLYLPRSEVRNVGKSLAAVEEVEIGANSMGGGGLDWSGTACRAPTREFPRKDRDYGLE